MSHFSLHEYSVCMRRCLFIKIQYFNSKISSLFKAPIMYRLFIIYILFIKAAFGSIDYDNKLNIKLYHALDPKNKDVFSERGNITIDSTKSGSNIINQLDLSTSDLNLLQEFAKQDGMYRLKSVIINLDGTRDIYLSSLKARALLASQLSDTIIINLGHSGSIIGVSLSVLADASEYSINDNNYKKFNSIVHVKHMAAAPIPDTASYIQKIEREKEARERGEVKDNRSFLAKYWMYIVPIAIFVLISGAANPEAQTGGR